jgi:hypothetical protein
MTDPTVQLSCQPAMDFHYALAYPIGYSEQNIVDQSPKFGA